MASARDDAEALRAAACSPATGPTRAGSFATAPTHDLPRSSPHRTADPQTAALAQAAADRQRAESAVAADADLSQAATKPEAEVALPAAQRPEPVGHSAKAALHLRPFRRQKEAVAQPAARTHPLRSAPARRTHSPSEGAEALARAQTEALDDTRPDPAVHASRPVCHREATPARADPALPSHAPYAAALHRAPHAAEPSVPTRSAKALPRQVVALARPVRRSAAQRAVVASPPAPSDHPAQPLAASAPLPPPSRRAAIDTPPTVEARAAASQDRPSPTTEVPSADRAVAEPLAGCHALSDDSEAAAPSDEERSQGSRSPAVQRPASSHRLHQHFPSEPRRTEQPAALQLLSQHRHFAGQFPTPVEHSHVAAFPRSGSCRESAGSAHLDDRRTAFAVAARALARLHHRHRRQEARAGRPRPSDSAVRMDRRGDQHVRLWPQPRWNATGARRTRRSALRVPAAPIPRTAPRAGGGGDGNPSYPRGSGKEA